MGLVNDALGRIVRNRGLAACCEVPLLGRCVDLAYIKAGCLITVEFKLRDWRRALAQARDHLLGADHAYVCMPERRVSNGMRDAFLEAGVGLVFYREHGSWPFETVIEAPESQETWAVARAGLCSYIASNGGERL